MPIRVRESGRSSDIVLRVRKVVEGRVRAARDSIDIASAEAEEAASAYVAYASRVNLKERVKKKLEDGSPNPYPHGRFETGEMLEAWSKAPETRVTGKGAVSVTFGPREAGYDDHFALQEVGFEHPVSGLHVPGMFAGHYALTTFKEIFTEEYRKRSRRKEYRE